MWVGKTTGLLLNFILGYFSNNDVVKVLVNFFPSILTSRQTMTMTTTNHPSTKDDILRHLLAQGQATAQDLAEALDISPQAIRRHLKDLEVDGLIHYKSVQVGMGRPQHMYELTGKGRDRFGHRYDDFAVSLLDTLTEAVGPDRVSSILQKQWERKAREYRQRLGSGSLPERVATLVELRQAEGYMAEWHPVEANGNGNSGRKFIITEHNCAISSVAESFPSVCNHELEMFAAVLHDCTVERTFWMIDGEHRCAYLIQPRHGETGRLGAKETGRLSEKDRNRVS